MILESSLYKDDSDFEIINPSSPKSPTQSVRYPDAQVALAWLLSKPAITAPIIGASKPGHLEDAVAALSVKLTQDDITQLEELYQPHPVMGHS